MNTRYVKVGEAGYQDTLESERFGQIHLVTVLSGLVRANVEADLSGNYTAGFTLSFFSGSGTITIDASNSEFYLTVEKATAVP